MNGEALATTADVERATATDTAAQQSANEAAQSAQQANTAATNVINGLQPLAKVQIAAGQAVGAGEVLAVNGNSHFYGNITTAGKVYIGNRAIL